jgi:L-Lysine epsilon oxidase N-terminal/L-lysine epsilon oxidase C-terminal domain
MKGKVYKIHPAIGVARLGNHPDAFYIGPESPGSPGLEIGDDGTESPLESYKDGGRVKRQAARFRVFEYEQALDGTLELQGEVTADAEIEWKVDLVNRKAALDRNVRPAEPRNTDIADRDSLIIRNPQPVAISGQDQPGSVLQGKFLGTDVYLGELRTDARGPLLVLGGRGTSLSVPAGVQIIHFANNDRWCDDVSDGPVSATVTLPGQSPVAVHESAWVVVGPPDFAPTVHAIVSLYDIAFQCGIDRGALRPDPVPSFTRHIRPLIERATDLRWVDSWAQWNGLQPLDWDALADPSPDAQPLRQRIAGRIKNPNLTWFKLPVFLETYLKQWAAGDFRSDLHAEQPSVPLPERLDQAALGTCTGNNFYPGIEAGQNLKDQEMYLTPFRLDVADTARVYPGCLTEIMAVPWQADFLDCDGGAWWPNQRPDLVMTDPDNVPGSEAEWEDPIAPGSYAEMVDHVLRLGFIVPQEVNGRQVLVEVDRDPTFPRR